jgi:threonine/homoserine/homoserine lactone efflux protein
MARLYRQGVVVNVLNPKTALFFLAFLPQFVDPAGGATWAQILLLGLLCACFGFLSDGTWTLVRERWASGCAGAPASESRATFPTRTSSPWRGRRALGARQAVVGFAALSRR